MSAQSKPIVHRNASTTQTTKENEAMKASKQSKPAKSKTPKTASTTMTPKAKTTTPKTPTAAAQANAVPLGIPLPPPGANIPSPPAGFVPESGFARGVRPNKTEANAMSGAVTDLQAFTNYEAVLGQGVTDQADVIQTFTAAGAWSLDVMATKAWLAYAWNEEGVAWTVARGQMATLKPAFLLAAKADPSLLTKYPKLATVLGARSTQAKKGVATRTANQKATAKGELPTHGAVGKQRLKAAEKAALAAATSPAPAAQPAAAAHAPAAAAPAVATVTNGAVTNGASTNGPPQSAAVTNGAAH